MNDRGDSHAWFREVRIAYSSRVLEESEMRDFEEHLEGCAECSEFARTFAAEEDLPPDAELHVPAWLLVRWQDLAPRLTGLSRAAVRAHLVACSECRDDLEFLGNSNALDAWPAGDLPLVATGLHAGARREEGVDAGPHPLRPMARMGSRWKAGGIWNSRRAMAAWASLSTAAALALLLRGLVPPPPSSRVLPWVAPVVLRGEGSHTQLHVEPGTRRVVVAVPIPARAGVDLRVEVFGAKGDRLLSETVPSEELGRGSLAILVESPNPLPFGTYRVLARFDSSAGPDSTAMTFDLLRAP